MRLWSRIETLLVLLKIVASLDLTMESKPDPLPSLVERCGFVGMSHFCKILKILAVQSAENRQSRRHSGSRP